MVRRRRKCGRWRLNEGAAEWSNERGRTLKHLEMGNNSSGDRLGRSAGGLLAKNYSQNFG